MPETFNSSELEPHIVRDERTFIFKNLGYDAVESGFSTFEDGETCVLGFGHFIRLPATSAKSELCGEVPFHVNLHIFVSTGLGENVSAGRNALA